MTRQSFQDELDTLERRALDLLADVGEALKQGMRAVDERDHDLANEVITWDVGLHGRCTELHADLLSCIARQIPVAGDLRLLVALMHVVQYVERMGDQCVKVARLAQTLGRAPELDSEVLDCLREMAAIIDGEIAKAGQAFARRDVALAEEIVRDDAEVNERNLRCFRLAVRLGRDERMRPALAEVALTARAMERIGDNAVDIGEQAAFVVTGVVREFADASHPVSA